MKLNIKLSNDLNIFSRSKIINQEKDGGLLAKYSLTLGTPWTRLLLAMFLRLSLFLRSIARHRLNISGHTHLIPQLGFRISLMLFLAIRLGLSV